MGVKHSEVCHTILQNQDHCLKIKLKIFFPFDVIGTDYVGPIYNKTKKRSELKAYILLFFCSVNSPISLPQNLSRVLKRLALRRGKPIIIYSDNAKTFKAETK